MGEEKREMKTEMKKEMMKETRKGTAEGAAREEPWEAKETKLAVIGIIIEDKRQAEAVNGLLHQYASYIIGRTYEKRQVNIISIVVDAPADVISALSGKLGRLPGVSSKAIHSRA